MSEQSQHDRRAAVIASLRPRDRANAFYRLLVLAIKDLPLNSDAALDDLATAGAGIVYRALERMSDGKQRDELLARLINGIPKALAQE
jgi:hypothetical protein